MFHLYRKLLGEGSIGPKTTHQKKVVTTQDDIIWKNTSGAETKDSMAKGFSLQQSNDYSTSKGNRD